MLLSSDIDNISALIIDEDVVEERVCVEQYDFYKPTEKWLLGKKIIIEREATFP